MKAFLVAALLLATVTVPARAQQKSTISFTIENDSFLGTDRYYTHGFRLQYMHRPNEVPQWADRLVHAIPPLGMNPERVRIGGALGQELFTPIRIGTDERTIVAGIGKGYRPEDLPGRTIVVVANLKPATLMGVESQGMLLAANDPREGSNLPILVTVVDPDTPDGFEVR